MLHIALINNDPEHTAALSERLGHEARMEVVAAGSFDSDILERLVEQPPDVVILDPPAEARVVRGASAAIQAALPHVRLIVTSLDDDHDHIRRIWAASGDAFVPQKGLVRKLNDDLLTFAA
jgi:DNA-binding NarL/FixJ family response regulator